MNTEVKARPVAATDHEEADGVNVSSWSLWARQIRAILRLELKKNFLNRRAFALYLLALLPVLLLTLLALVPPPSREFNDFNMLGEVFAVVYEGLILRTIVFFGCAWVFMNLFRGEVIDRSLHYYFLSPVRREVLVCGKYLSGLATTATLFGATTVLSYALLFIPHGGAAGTQHLFAGAGLGRLLTYLLITVLACLGYGAFFLAAGLLFRNPIIPALALYGWEWVNFLLPPVLKKASVIHYLQSLTPVPVTEGPFAFVAEPTPAWLSVPGLIVITAVVIVFSGWRIRRMEIKYGSD